MKRLLVALSALACLALAPAQDGVRYLSGSVTYRDKVALPKDAVVTVTLEDSTVGDRAGQTISQTSIPVSGKQVPINFTLRFDAKQILEGHQYSVRAQIMSGVKQLYISSGFQSVSLAGQPLPVQIVLQKVVLRHLPEPVEKNSWIPYELKGVRMLTEGTREFSFKFNPDQKKFSAFVGVNQIGGSYEIDGMRLTFGDTYATKMAGPSELMAQESSFMKVLGRVNKVKVFDDRLVFYAGNVSVLKLRVAKPEVN